MFSDCLRSEKCSNSEEMMMKNRWDVARRLEIFSFSRFLILMELTRIPDLHTRYFLIWREASGTTWKREDHGKWKKNCFNSKWNEWNNINNIKYQACQRWRLAIRYIRNSRNWIIHFHCFLASRPTVAGSDCEMCERKEISTFIKFNDSKCE